MKNETNIIKEILGEEFAQTIIRDLGIEADTAEEQADFLAMLGGNIMSRIVWELIKAVPVTDHQALKDCMEHGDIDALKAIAAPYVIDVDTFARREAEKEYETIKARAHMIEQGVDAE